MTEKTTSEKTTAAPRPAPLPAELDTGAEDSTIRPFHIDVPEEELADLRRRIAATRWPEKETVEDTSQGVQLVTMQALARYWATEYDWRKCEARLNAFPQFITEIDGLDIHFVHVRSKHEDALPLIVTHGWPGSFVEQMKIVDLLTDPTAHGASASDAFHVVIPNMPGYGFSGKPTTTGWGPIRIAGAWVELMKRLGYAQFVAAGGDWGGVVVEVMAGGRDAPASAEPAPPELLGIHTNFPGVVPPEIDKAIQTGGPLPSDLSDDERRATEQLGFLYQHVAYGLMMGTRPQTLYGLADSPVDLAAFMLDHDAASYELISRVFVDGAQEGLTRDDVLDNITLFWLTNTGVSASRLYWEWLSRDKGTYLSVKNVTVPVAVSVFPDEVYQAPRSWVEQAYPNLIHFNEVDRGGHFAAWEQPELYASEVRAGLRSLR
jgi:pimeloyl-ACP methyl ester carboxylesterase